MNIQKVTAGIVFFLFAMFTFQAQAGVTLKLGVQESSSGSVTIPLTMSADEAVSITGGQLTVEYDSNVLTPDLDAVSAATGAFQNWNVTVSEQPPAPDSSIATSAFQLTFYPDATDTSSLSLTAGQEYAVLSIPAAVSGAVAVKKSELFIENGQVGFEGAVDHVFVNFDDGAVKMTSWDSVWQNASDTTLQVSDLAGKLFFQIKTNDDGSKYARKWLFKNVDNVKDGWIKEFRGKNPTTGVAVVVVKHFNWSVDTSGRLNLVGNGIETGTDWGRTFAKLPGATAHQLPLYGGETSIDGTATPLLFEINRDFTVSVTDSMPYMLELENEDKGPEYSEVVLLEQYGAGKSGDSQGDQGYFDWRIGTSADDDARGAIIITVNDYGTTREEVFHILADSEVDDLLMVSIDDEGFELTWAEVLEALSFDATDDLINFHWQLLNGNDEEFVFNDVASSETIIAGQVSYTGNEQEGFSSLPFDWVVDASGTLHLQSDHAGSERLVKVEGGGSNGYMALVFLDDPSGVERFNSGFSFNNFDGTGGAALWLSRDTAGDSGDHQDGNRKRMTLEVAGLSNTIQSIDLTLRYDCPPGRLMEVDGMDVAGEGWGSESNDTCQDGYSHQIIQTFSSPKNNGTLLNLDFELSGNYLQVEIDSASATDSSETTVNFIRTEGADIVGKQLILVAEIEAINSAGDFEYVNVAAPQNWYDPVDNRMTLPSNLNDLEGLIEDLRRQGYTAVDLGGNAGYEGEGFRIRFAVYTGSISSTGGVGGDFEYDLPTELVKVSETFQDPYNYNIFDEGWYKKDLYGMEKLVDGTAVTIDAVQTVGGVAVEYGQQVMLDVLVFSQNGEGGPLGKPVVLNGASFDPHSNSVNISSVDELETLWSGLRYDTSGTSITISQNGSDTVVNATSLPPEDASATGLGYVFMVQVFEGQKDASGTVTVDSTAAPVFEGSMELVKVTADGYLDGNAFTAGNYTDPFCDTTASTCTFANAGWYVHSYNDDIDQDILWPVMGGDYIEGRRVEYSDDGSRTSDTGGGFGGEELIHLDSSITKFVLAQMNFEAGTLGTQFALTGITVTEGSDGNQMTTLPAVSVLPDGSDSAFVAMDAVQFDPTDPKGGNGHTFKILAFHDATDSTNPTGNNQYDEGESVLEMDGMVVYVTAKARSPLGDKILNPGWYVVRFSYDGDEVIDYEADREITLLPFVSINDMQGGVNKEQEGGCEQVNTDTSDPYNLCQVIGTVSGKIVDGQGNGIPNLWLNFEPNDWEDAAWGGTNTKNDGTFTIKLTGNERYRIWVDTFGAQGGYLGGYYNGSGGLTEMWDQAELVVAERLGNSLPNISLTQGISVTITVQDSQNNPVQDLWVNLEPDGEGNWAGANTDSFGMASVGVQSGRYRIWVDTYNTGGEYISGYYDAATGGVNGDWGRATILPVRADTNVTVTLTRGLTLTGTVLDGTGAAIGDAGISIRSKGEQEQSTDEFYGGWNDPFAGGFQTWTSTKCDDPSKSWCNDMQGSLTAGQFSATVEPNKEYMVEVNTPDGMGGAFVYTATNSSIVDNSATATVEGGLTREWNEFEQAPVYDPVRVGSDSVDIEVRLKQGAQITGHIQKSDGTGLDHAWVDFNSDEGGWGGASTEFQNNGAFTVQLEPGKTYRMNVWPSWEDEQQNGILGGQVKFNTGDDLTDGDASGTITQNWDDASMITLTDASTSLTIDVTVGSGASINGTVKTNHAAYCTAQNLTPDSDGYCGMRDVHVNAWSEDGYGGRGGPTNYDGSGDYRINMAEGTGYIIDVWTPNGMNAFYGGDRGTVFSWDEAQRIQVDSHGFYHKQEDGTYETTPRTGTLDLRLKKSYAISGRITESDGTPVRWIWVNAFSKSKDRWMGTSTNNNGFFRMEVPESEDYIVEVWGGDRGFTTSYYSRNGSVTDERRASRLDLTSQDQTGINVEMSSGRKISGVVKGLSAGERLWINAWSEGSINGGGAEAVGTGSGDASFEIKGLSPATDYQVDWWHYRYASGFYGDTVDSIDVDGYHSPVDWHDRAQIDTSSADVTNLKIALATGGTLTGSVSGLQSGDKVYINLWSESGRGFGWSEVTGDADAESADSFSIEGLKTATDYIMDIHPDWNSSGDYKGGFYKTTDNHTSGSLTNWNDKTQISVTSGQTTTLPDLSLVSNAGKIIGSIAGLDAGDRAWVDVWSEKSGSWAGVEIQGTDSTETFTLKGLDVADDYRLNIWVDGKAGGFYAGPGNGLTNFWDQAYKLSVINGADTTTVDGTALVLTIETGVQVQGTITGLDSGRFAWIDMFDEGMMFGNGTGVTGEGTSSSVTFTLDGMKRTNTSNATGYRVMMDPDGYPMQFWNNESNATTWDNATLMQLTADSTDQISFTISEGNDIAGTISGFNRNDWIFIDAWSKSTGQMGFANVESTNVTCEENGVTDDCSATYTIQGLSPAADYVVGADRNGMRVFYSSTAGSVPFPDNATVVDASSGDQSSIDLTFDVTTHTLTATVAGLSDSDTVYVNAWDPQGGFGWKKLTGNGSVVIEKLPAGNYYVSAWADGKAELFYKDGTDTTERYHEAGQLSISGDVATSFSWANVTTHLISGTVLDASGTAVTDQLVSAFSNNASAYQSVITDSNGAYEFKALTPASDYVVDAWTVDGHLEVTGVDISTADATGTTLQPVSSGRHDLTITTGTGMGIVGLFDASGTFVQAGVADASGTLQFKGLDDTTSYTIKLDANMDGDYADTDGSDTSAVHSSGTTLQF